MRTLAGLAMMIVVFIAVGAFLISITPDYVVEASRQHSFVVDTDFASVRKSLQKEDIMDRILAANNGRVLSKHWTHKDFDIKHILSKKRRTWIFNGTVLAKISIRDSHGGEMIVNLRQDLHVTQDVILAHVKLDQPLDVGVSDVDQEIEIKPYGPGQTQVTIKLYMKFCRRVPSVYRKYASTRINESADRQIYVIEPQFRAMLANHR